VVGASSGDSIGVSVETVTIGERVVSPWSKSSSVKPT
jgi:hypothetical protein